MRMHAIMIKTLKDMTGLRRTLLFLVGVLIVPLLGSGMFSEGTQISSMSLAMQDQMIVGFFIVISFMWMAGIPLVLLAGLTCSGFIAKESEEGTLLMLVSKPIRRYEIVAGKFLAFMVNSILLSTTAILMSALIVTSTTEADAYIVGNVMSMVPPLLLYAVFVTAVFGSMATALSAISRSGMKAGMVMAGITILIFFGMMILRMWLGGFYEGYYISSVDPNYHLGNAYLLFVESSGYRMAPMFQGIMGTFTGTFDAADMYRLYDVDIGALPPELAPKPYAAPVVSLALWVLVACAFFAAGLLRFERREVS